MSVRLWRFLFLLFILSLSCAPAKRDALFSTPSENNENAVVFKGILINTSGETVGGIRVILSSGGVFDRVITMSDTNGQFAFHRLPNDGPLHLVVKEKVYETIDFSPILFEKGATGTYYVPMIPKAHHKMSSKRADGALFTTLAVFIRTYEGAPIPDSVVQLQGKKGAYLGTVSNKEGKAFFPKVKVGASYKVTIEAIHYHPLGIKRIFVETGEPIELITTLMPSTEYAF